MRIYKMKVYRVESNFTFIHNKQAGIGPYDARSSVRGKTEEIKKFMRDNYIFNYSAPCVSSENNPTPEKDGLPKNFGKEFFFAFQNISFLKDWFDAYQIKKMSIAGFYIAVYDTENFIEGEKQVIFNKKDSQLINFLSLSEI